MKKWLCGAVVVAAVVTGTPVQAAYIYKNGRLYDARDVAYLTLEEHYNLGIAAIKEKNWEEAVRQFRICTVSFPDAELTQDAHYFLGVAYYETGDLDLANKSLTQYLQTNRAGKNNKYFLQAFNYKFAIAQRFQSGEKVHLFHQEKLPKWQPAQDDAIAIYDEIINTLVNNELAAKALFFKGKLQKKENEFKDAIESFQTVIRKFPRSDMALKSYIMIAKTYLKQCQNEIQNSDLLGLAEVNVKRMAQDFPKAEERQIVSDYFIEMKEIYADSLFETGRLYERKGQPKAAVLYYHTALTRFPDTTAANDCKERIAALEPYAKEVGHVPTDS